MILEIIISFLIAIFILSTVIGIILLLVRLHDEELLGITFGVFLILVFIFLCTLGVYKKIQEHKVKVLYETEIMPKLNPSLSDK